MTDGTSANQVWLLHNGAVSSTVSVPYFNANWLLMGIGDFNGDGIKDLLYQRADGQQLAIYLNTSMAEQSEGVTSGRTQGAIQPLSAPDTDHDSVISYMSYTLPSGVENLTLAPGAGAINGTGNNLANVIIGNESANVITDGGGNDTLVGNGGYDTYQFGHGGGQDTGRSDLRISN